MTGETASTRLGRGKVPVSVLWLIGLNLLIRIIWILYMHPTQSADFEWYYTHAVALAQGHGYYESGKPTAYWPIGWPVILSIVVRIFGPHVMAGLVTNVIFSTIIVIMIYALTLRVLGVDKPPVVSGEGFSTFATGSGRNAHQIAFTAALGYSLLPSQIEWNSILGSEESFTLLLIISLYLYAGLVRRQSNAPWFWRTTLAGIVFGLASIVRPIGLLFPVFLAAYEFWVNRRQVIQALLRGITFGVSMLVGILPITIRNLIAMHSFVLVSTNGGVALWQGTQINGGYFWTWNPYKNPLLKVYNNEVLRSQVGKHVAMMYWLHHPVKTIINGCIKIFDLYKVDTNAVWYTFYAQYPHAKGVLYTFDIIDTLAYWVMAFIAVFALIILSIRSQKNQQLLKNMFSVGITARDATVSTSSLSHFRRALGFVLTFMLYNTLLFFFFPAWDRYRYPLMPFVAILFAIGFTVIRVQRSEQKKKLVTRG
ncbi:hypothetical protein JZ786_21860 [Alicyclobacillus mengziensis]|uniref:Glycosyltransferase RgtA/B/C/D-like domain-containing protein n=1 Tax=Alicyclobacillus mengziensis TaxID=2931921 RepID=A0A9X7Z735_9BACL|nr:hypothetical protein JZ786_21860 [Alicyclobacillus mengziensis]